MIENLLRSDVQEFIQKNRNTPLTTLAFLKSPFPDISMADLVEQIEGWQKSKEKLPNWNKTAEILFPPRISMEQCSSELSAQYKTSIVNGHSLLDMTGGFGVDSAAFSQKIEKITYCEQNPKLNELAKHNFQIFNFQNIDCFSCNALDFLHQNTSLSFDWIYVDPSRRDENGNRVFALRNCTPDIVSSLPLFFKHTNNILIKLSPMLDISQVMNELEYVREVHIVAIKNEVRELLFVLQNFFSDEAEIHTVNFTNEFQDHFKFTFSDEKKCTPTFSNPQRFLYEPNAAILKAGAFHFTSKYFNINKIHKNSHLYTSPFLVKNFQGRIFEIVKVSNFGKDTQHEISQLKKANIAIRNFPQSVDYLKKKLKINEGGEDYLFFTTLQNEEKVVIFCRKINS